MPSPAPAGSIIASMPSKTALTATLSTHLLPLKKPLHTAAGSVHRRQAYVISVRDHKAHGLGEATPLPVFGGEDPLRCQQALQAALPEIPAICQALARTRRTQRNAGQS